MENKKLTRSNNRMLAGVCAGLADYFGWDVTIVRIIYSFATVFTAFSGIIVYIILWIVTNFWIALLVSGILSILIHGVFHLGD